MFIFTFIQFMFSFSNVKMSTMKSLLDNEHRWTTKRTLLNIALVVSGLTD